MKKILFLSILMLLPMLASAQTVSDVQNSGCLNKTRGDESQSVPTIVLTKEGNILSVQLLNYEENCCAEDFNVTSSINSNSDSGSYWVSINIDAGGRECDCICPFNVSFTVRDLEPNSFYLDCWWYEGLVELTEGEPLVLEHNDSDTQEYFPEGTKWTEIRLDTLKYDSWYSKVGDEWVPNFETIEYYVKGKYSDGYGGIYNCVYTNGPEWTDSLMLLIPCEGDFLEPNSVMVSVLSYEPEGVYAFWPAEVYQFDWNVGKGIYYENILMANTTSAVRSQGYYGIIHEIKEGYFGGVRPLKYVDLDGKAPENKPHSNIKNGSTKGGRIIQGIGITEWNDGECLFGPPNPYHALGGEYHGRHYRSMLVHFEQNGEVLYDVWPEKEDDYIPFVELGKQWHVTSTASNPYNSLYCFSMLEEVERNGKTYVHTCYSDNEQKDHSYELFREENKRVYMYDDSTEKEYLVYDFSLKEGDTFTYELMTGYPEQWKVLKQGWLEDGPDIVSSCTSNPDGTLDIKYRKLRTWTVGREDDETGEYYAVATWVECVGVLEGMFCQYCTGGTYYLSFVERAEDMGDNWENNIYLPFSFYNNNVLFKGNRVHGSNMPTGATNHPENGWFHNLTYELEGDRLHVYGDVYSNCGPNNYAYFFEEPTDDPSVHKIEFLPYAAEPAATCMRLHSTDFYVPGFDPNLNYYVIDNRGVEHPVINKMTYRPFIEEDKVWVLRLSTEDEPEQEWFQYYYFDGDTIVNGQTAKRMFVDIIGSIWDTSGEYVGAWYEQDKKVYYAAKGKQQFELLYDFTLSTGDNIQSKGRVWQVTKMSGGIPGFKGTYYGLQNEYQTSIVEHWLEGVGSMYYPWLNLLEGWSGASFALLVCKTGDEIIYYNSEEEDPFSMGAKKHRFDFTHTIKTKPKARTREDDAEPLYGEYNNQLLDIRLNPLDATYLVRITNESGQVVYEKNVNAGSIVGLNIDISAFAKGRYTVTIENSGESFTGEFETITTGIQELKRSRIEDLKSIYNLQGQQLKTAPQKGIYIRNGKKVVIK